nr:hypothetical protein [Bifidobacterium catenulatum]
MSYIHITEENIDKEHICCAMSGKQSLAKKEWLKQRFNEGLVFYRSEERGKCFIEYIPAENAWVPIDADGWIYINCLWVANSSSKASSPTKSSWHWPACNVLNLPPTGGIFPSRRQLAYRLFQRVGVLGLGRRVIR